MPSYAEGDSVLTTMVTTTSSDARLLEISDLYEKGMAREQLGSYEKALSAYQSLLTKISLLLNRRPRPSENVYREIFPYAIAAAYRQGLVTHRMIESSVVQLHTQLERYAVADTWINEVLTALSNFHIESHWDVSDTQFGMLYFARAYNRLGWSYAVFNGSAWKRYLIYAPAIVIVMVEESMKDLTQVLKGYHYSYVYGEKGEDLNGVLDRFFTDGVSAVDRQIFKLCYRVPSLDVAKAVAKKQLSANVKQVLDHFYMQEVQTVFAKGRQIYTFEDFLKPEAGQVTQQIATLLNAMSFPAK